MSGSGGFYKYRCKYFLTHNCPNWVYANGHACSMCLAEGREATEPSSMPTHTSTNPWHQQQHPSTSTSTEICVPQAFHGTLRYTVMEVIPTDESSTSSAAGGGSGSGGKAYYYWVLRQKAMELPRSLPMAAITTSDTPRPVMSMVGVGMGGSVRVGY